MKSKILIAVTTMLVLASLSVPIRLASQSQTTNFLHYKLIDIGTFGGPYSSTPSLNAVGPSLASRRGWRHIRPLGLAWLDRLVDVAKLELESCATGN